MSRKKYGYRRRDAKQKQDQEDKWQRRELANAEISTIGTIGIPDPSAATRRAMMMSLDLMMSRDRIREDKRKWYILDTNLILSCVDVLYDPTDENWRPPIDFRPSLDDAHLIIPDVVFEELNHIKDSYTVNRATARTALKRLANYFPNSERTLRETMILARPVPTGWKQQVISLLKLHRDFSNSLPWVPDAKDNDGWIAVTALAATMIRDGLPVDGTVPRDEMLERGNTRRDVVLLTRDHQLLSKANNYAVRSQSYSFQERPIFTGMRELVVPAEMLEKFYYEGRLTKAEFEKYLPQEPPLVANEYIVMTPEGDAYPKAYFVAGEQFSNVARYHKAEQLLLPMRHVKCEGEVPPNVGIATYYDAMNDDDIRVIVATGKAGTGKTYQIVRHAIKALREGRYATVVLIVNSDNGVGYLPGSQENKLEPMVAFCKDAIRSYLAGTPEFKRKRATLRKYGDIQESGSTQDGATKASITISRRRRKKVSSRNCHTEIKFGDEYDYIYEGDTSDDLDTGRGGTRNNTTKGSAGKTGKSSPDSKKTYYELLEEQVDYIYRRYFIAIPYKQAQGRTFEDAILVIDEAQRIIIDEMETFITRLGRNSMLVVCGDVNQINHNSPEKRIKNGLIFTRKIYYDWDGCANIHLTDNMRHEAADIANQNYERIIEDIGALQT